MFFTYVPYFEGSDMESAILDYPDPPWLEITVGAYNLAIGTVIPLTVIITSNILIIASVKRSAISRSKMAAQSDTEKGRTDERQLTRMLILVSIAYVIFSVPIRTYEIILTIPEIVSTYNMNDPYWRLRYNVQFWLLAEMHHMNYAVNFYLYILGGGGKYRRNVKEVFKSCRRCIMK
jgi:hypothetical protein